MTQGYTQTATFPRSPVPTKTPCHNWRLTRQSLIEFPQKLKA